MHNGTRFRSAWGWASLMLVVVGLAAAPAPASASTALGSAVSRQEAERLGITPRSATVRRSRTAGGGRALVLRRAVRLRVRTGADKAALRIRSTGCRTGARLRVTSGRRVRRAFVARGSWRTVRVKLRGARRLSLRPEARGRCRGRVWVDWVSWTRSGSSPGTAPPPPASPVPPGPGTPPPGTGQPPAARPLYRAPGSNAERQAAEWRSTRPADAALMEKLASQPQSAWIGGWSGDPGAAASAIVGAAAQAGALPVLVPYNIPGRDCDGYSAGGAPDAAAYRTWIRRLAAGIADRPALVVLEPDALAGMDCKSAAVQNERVALLADAVAVLSALPQTTVYVDAGHAGWHPAGTMAGRLRRVGAGGRIGFAVNVSNFHDDPTSLSYAQAISRELGGAHFVIDTSRNGRGSLGTEWCNPAGRGLGRQPTTATGVAGYDAALWIKVPGESDGECERAEPPAGTWWPEYALGLTQRASW